MMQSIITISEETVSEEGGSKTVVPVAQFIVPYTVAENNSWVREKLERGTWGEDELIPITVMIQREKTK